MNHIATCIKLAARHPRTALIGAREFRSGVGMTYDAPTRSDAYDAGRELAHLATLRRWDW
jgi:hypothetical protein